MNEYFEGSVDQHFQRGQLLLGRIPRQLPREFHLLAQTCRKELTSVIGGLQSLLQDPKMSLPDHQPERLRQFRRLVAQLNFLETVGVAALERSNETDRRLNSLIDCVRQEIAYPLLPPVVSSLSQQYFHIFPQLNLLCVPLSEADFLLHLPDLYHELAHPLVIEKYDLRVKPFQAALSQALDLVLTYLAEEQEKDDRRRGPEHFGFYLRQWERSWWKWVVEFFCDLFAVYTIGPAFVWAHFHLCAKTGQDPFHVPTAIPSSHPADDARLKVQLFGLRLVGFSSEADRIERRWKELNEISGARAEPEYLRCYPAHILQKLAQEGLRGVSDMGCRTATLQANESVYSILNEAWDEFWRNPSGFASWERDAVERLRVLCQHA